MYFNVICHQYIGNISKTPHRNWHKPTLLDGCTDWHAIVDVDRQLAFPTEITSTRQRPDLVIWSVNSKKVIIAELTIPFETNIDWAHQPKLEKYEDLREQCIKNGWSYFLSMSRFYFERNLYIFNQTQIFTNKEEGIYKKIKNKTLTASERIWHSYRSNTIQ